jgi:hypothetical protein
MKKEIAEKWVQALRSGEYRQGRGVLCDIYDGKRRFCCLGVLCEVAINSGLKIETKEKEKYGALVMNYARSHIFLPESVRNFTEMHSINGEIFLEEYGGKVSLADLNDHKNFSFESIANVIEAHWEEL